MAFRRGSERFFGPSVTRQGLGLTAHVQRAQWHFLHISDTSGAIKDAARLMLRRAVHCSVEAPEIVRRVLIGGCVTVELRPLGVLCNLHCRYCYQNPQRTAGNTSRRHDLERMKAAVEVAGGPFTLFGGEPLLLPKKDLEESWSWGFVRWGRNALQTNGVLIDSQHIEMFRKYDVAVGISIDGPADLNSARSAGAFSSTVATTEKTQANILRLCN